MDLSGSILGLKLRSGMSAQILSSLVHFGINSLGQLKDVLSSDPKIFDDVFSASRVYDIKRAAMPFLKIRGVVCERRDAIGLEETALETLEASRKEFEVRTQSGELVRTFKTPARFDIVSIANV